MLQTLLPALLFSNTGSASPSTVTIKGGTHNPLAPTTDFLQQAFVPALAKLGMHDDQNPAQAGSERIVLHHWDELLNQWAIQKLKNGEMKILDIATPMFERTLITAALQQTRGRKRHAAELLGWGRNTLTRKLKELGMDSTEDDEEEEKTLVTE